jgi:regulator of sirC expression with transglutaminase-like and TPR domain
MRQAIPPIPILLLATHIVVAADKTQTVELLTATARQSVVVITVKGRDGKFQGLGTGFIVSADGLIATNLHVIGESRPITVELPGGQQHEVKEIHAHDRSLDLALIRIDAKNLPALELGDSDILKDGQAVIALGNPQGLKRSVVAGVVSAQREIDGRKMIQLAIPLERGNSGGPLLDMQGKVQGILTIKSLVTENLGYAVTVNELKTLLDKPNPVPMANWLTLGSLDPSEWTPLFGAQWKRRAGRIQVEGAGSGFGGRSLLLYEQAVPDLPYEIAASVRLDDEAGAAGLIFCSDGNDRHYGFYPTGGRLRLTYFDGPDVFSWKILKDQATPHYRPGDWNQLRVRVEKDKLLCFVNDQLVIEAEANHRREGKAGLAKFRDTRAEFKQFRIGGQLAAAAPSAELTKQLDRLLKDLPKDGPPKPATVAELTPLGAGGVTRLREQARLLERQAVQLKQLAQAVHQKSVLDELTRVLEGKDEDINLVRAALLIAKLDHEELELEVYLKEIDRLARDLAAALPKDADEAAKLAALNKFLFTERGFHGSRSDYYNRSNSYLNEVLDDREGLPITLSVIYLELARRSSLKMEGVGLPGHFVVRHIPAKGEPQLLDVFDAGKPLSREQADQKVRSLIEEPLREEHLKAMTRRAIVVRMLQNLLGVARGERDVAGVLRYLDAILTVTPDAAEERWIRAVLRYQSGQRDAAREDADWLLEHHPKGMNLEPVRELKRRLDGE